ncbi:hypothetical protein OB236_38435 [Paenibacillus sp. WQ 127069]|uniref:Bacterial toxin 44 domain-containing protein n=1 Tax=Paenibacillus baimaensis TaxID=2982185 RepID=A0ABT2UTN0_9BACL|nr:hypothetical protein [Paenibacillus sp. WQ 127069]MCU6798020.1 hypothetical protein [Paenibacillus sp. WQ 127069]
MDNIKDIPYTAPVSINLYEVSYPAEMFGDHPAYTILKTAETAGKAKYDEYIDVTDCWDISFMDFCKCIRVRKIGQSAPLPNSAPFRSPERIELVNRLIREIGDRGRQFLYSKKHERYAAFHWANGRLWYTDDYTGTPMLMEEGKEGKTREQKHAFSHGGTLWGLVNDFRDYIFGDDDANHNNGYGGLYCQHWGYPAEDIEAIREIAIELGYLKKPAVKSAV